MATPEPGWSLNDSGGDQGIDMPADDSSAPAVRALLAARSTAANLKAIDAQTRDLARRPMLAQEMAKMDAVVFDPPRAGALEQSQQIAASKVARVVGTDENRIVEEASILLSRDDEYAKMAHAANPYGDGRACERILAATASLFGRGEPLSDFVPHRQRERDVTSENHAIV